MTHDAALALAIACVVAALAVGLRATSPRRTSRPRRRGGAGYVRGGVLTPNEAEFHARLRRALGPRYEVWPQVAMLALVSPHGGPDGDWTAFNKVSNKRVDWVIAVDGEPRVVVELDDRTHEARRDRDRERDRILAACGWPVLRYESRAKPDEARIRADVRRSLEAGA